MYYLFIDDKGTLEGKDSCSTLDEDCDDEYDAQDIIDMVSKNSFFF